MKTPFGEALLSTMLKLHSEHCDSCDGDYMPSEWHPCIDGPADDEWLNPENSVEPYNTEYMASLQRLK